MALRLEIAKAQLKAFQKDRLFGRCCSGEEITGLAKISQALALIREAQADLATADINNPSQALKEMRESKHNDK